MRRASAKHPMEMEARTDKVDQDLPSRDALLCQLREIKQDLFTRYHIRSLGLFGSYGRNTPSRTSDIDILVSFSQTPSLFTFVRLKGELEQRLGHRVDLVMREALRPAIGKQILAEVFDA